jgi:RsiW-degrading membrane proteinase PrsW (M82 family)
MIYLILAIAPVIALILYIYYRDKHDREPVGLLIKVFFYGVLSVIPAAYLEVKLGIDNNNDLISTAYTTFLIIAGAEEGCKYLFMRWAAYNKKAFNEPFDGIVYCVMISMGFAAIENAMYIFRSDNPMGTALMRMLTAVPAHFTFAVVMGYYIGLAKFNPERKILYTVMGIGGAMFFHGLYDFFLIQQKYPSIFLGAFISLLVAIRLSLKALKIQSENSRTFMEYVNHPPENNT